MSLTKIQREALEAAREEARENGLEVEIVRHSRHLVVEVTNSGRRVRRFAISGSPRSECHRNWARQEVRRAARALV